MIKAVSHLIHSTVKDQASWMLSFANAPALVCILVMFGSPAVQALEGIRFEDGVTLRMESHISDPAKMKTALTEVWEKIQSPQTSDKPSASRDSGVWELKATVTDNPRRRSVQQICDQFVRLHLTPRMQPMPPTYTHLKLILDYPETGEISSCRYEIVQRIALRANGLGKEPLVPRNFGKLSTGWISSVPFIYLHDTSGLDVQGAFPAYAVVVPEKNIASANFAESVANIAESLFKQSERADHTVQIVALPEGSNGSFRVPGVTLNALRFEEDVLALYQEVKLRVVRVGEQEGTYFVEINAFSPKVKRAFAEADTESLKDEFAELADTVFIPEAERLFDAVGRKTAERAEVDLVVIQFSALIGKQGMNVRLPVRFSRTDGAWKREDIR